MGDDAAVWQHRFFTRLTTIKLAAAILGRDPTLSPPQHRLLQQARDAADALTADLMDYWQAAPEPPTAPDGDPRD